MKDPGPGVEGGCSDAGESTAGLADSFRTFGVSSWIDGGG